MKRSPLRRTIKPRRKSKHALLLETAKKRYDEYATLQGGSRCAICLREPKTRRLDIDHDHKLMTVRGLLCARCNRALPYWVTSSWLRAAADYLDHPPLRVVDEREAA